MLIGAHESISGGYEKSIHRAVEDGCESVQIFTGPPGRWKVPPVSAKAVGAFRLARRRTDIKPILVHAAYLINPAGPDPDLWVRSMVALREEYERARALGADGLILHPGSHRGTRVRDGVYRAAEMIGRLLDESKEGPLLMLENTAGSGSALGADFEQLAAIRELASCGNRIAYCLDTAHAFAAGYDLRDEVSVRQTMERIDGEVGLENIKALHLNDSAKELGSRVDRHARIGEGLIGVEGFRAILAVEAFLSKPGILETEPLPDAKGRYRPQVMLLAGLRKAA